VLDAAPVLDGDGVELGPVDPGDRPAEADAVALAPVRVRPGDGLLPGCPPATLDPGRRELPGFAPRPVRDAAADADWLAGPPEPAAS
jgi:hypothetical protein